MKKTKNTNLSMKCYNCGGRMEEGVELIISGHKTIPQGIMKCNNCGKSTVTSDEYERVGRNCILLFLTGLNICSKQIQNLLRYLEEKFYRL